MQFFKSSCFFILLFKEMFVQVQALQQRVQGPRSQIIACLIVNYPISHFYDLFIITAFIRYFQPSPSRTRENLYFLAPVVEPCYWFGSISYEQKGHQLLVSQLTEWEMPRALSCNSDQATFLTANAQSSQCEDPGSRAQLSQGGHGA